MESDKPDQYECIQCPAAKAPVAKMTSESRPPLYVASPPSVATDHQEAVLRERTSGESVTVRRSLFPSRPDAGVSLEIALAAAKARSHFHSRWLNEDNSTSEAPPPVVDTGQAKKHSHPTDACDTSRNSGRVKAVERLQEVPVKQEKVPSSKPPPLPTSDPPKKIVNDVSSKPTIDEPCKVSSEQPPKESVDGPSKVSSEQPSKAFADGPSKVSSEQPSKASSNEPSKVSSEQPSKASADGPLKVPSEQPPKVSVDGPSKDPTIASSKAAPEVTLPLTSIDDQSVNRRANDRPSLPTKPSHFPERPHSLALRSSFQPQATVKIRQTETVVVPEEVGRRPSSLPVVDVNQPKLPQENVDVTVSEDKRAAPVAAPRISRTKRQSKIPQQVPSEDQKPQQSLDGASKPFEVCVEQDDTGHGGRMPVPLKRTSLNSSSTELAAAAAPPKPPRRAVLPEPENEASSANRELEVQGGTVSQTPSAKTVDYPVDLNPFGDDDDKGTVKGLHAAVISSPAVPEVHVVKEKKSLNPFGDSDDELSDNDERLPKQQALPQRRLIPCDWYNKNLNPFSSDSDEEDEGSGHLKTPPEFPGDVEMNKEVPLSEKVEGRSVPRKKRAAPKPPSSGGPKATSESGFATPSPKLTPSGSPKSSGKSRAPKPPSPHPSHSRRHSSSPVSMRHTLSAQEAAQRISNWSDTSSSGVFQTPDSEGSRLSSVSGGSSVNTFGAWKKKKRRAPPLPIPQKRQVSSNMSWMMWQSTLDGSRCLRSSLFFNVLLSSSRKFR